MLAVQQEVSVQNNRRMVGKRVEVLIEGESKLVSRQIPVAGGVELGWERRLRQAEPIQLVGRTRGDQVVCIDGDRSLKGKLVDAEITSAQNLTLFARLVEQPAVA
jgi:tRNA A37 methylthiotransferase MiaB